MDSKKKGKPEREIEMGIKQGGINKIKAKKKKKNETNVGFG